MKSFRLEPWAVQLLEELATERKESQADALHYLMSAVQERERLLDQVIAELTAAVNINRRESVKRTDVRNALALLEQLRH